jgi:hypothetical protein
MIMGKCAPPSRSFPQVRDAPRMIRQHAGRERKRFLVWAQETQEKSFYDATQDELVPVNENLES